MSNDELTTSDWDTLFTKDPSLFVEALILNILYSSETDRDIILNRQRQVFEKWLTLYNQAYRDTIAKSVESRFNRYLQQAVEDAEKRGRIAALSSLPLKKSLLKQTIDLEAVTGMLKELKQEGGSPTKTS